MNKKKLKKILECTPEKYDLEVYAEKHKEMKDGNFKYLSKKDMAIAILSEIDDKRINYENLIYNIYEAIMYSKYFNCLAGNKGDTGLACNVKESISILNIMKHWDSHIDYYINEDTCKKVYKRLYNYARENGYSIPEEIEDEYKVDHIYDDKYLIRKFLEWNGSDKEYVNYIKEYLGYGDI